MKHKTTISRRDLALARRTDCRRGLSPHQAKLLAEQPLLERYEAEDIVHALTGAHFYGRQIAEALTGAAEVTGYMRPKRDFACGVSVVPTASVVYALMKLSWLGVRIDLPPLVRPVQARIKRQRFLTPHEVDVLYWRAKTPLAAAIVFEWPADTDDPDLPAGDFFKLAAAELHDGRVAVAFREPRGDEIVEVVGRPASTKLRRAMLDNGCVHEEVAAGGRFKAAIDQALAEAKDRAAEAEARHAAVNALWKAQNAGVTVEADGDNLALSADAEPPAGIIEGLRAHKPAVLKLLAEGWSAKSFLDRLAASN